MYHGSLACAYISSSLSSAKPSGMSRSIEYASSPPRLPAFPRSASFIVLWSSAQLAGASFPRAEPPFRARKSSFSSSAPPLLPFALDG